MERMNLEISEHIGTKISPERIQEGIRQLNGIRHIRERAFSAFGIGDDVNMREYSGVFESDVLSVCHHLKNALGFDGNNDNDKLFPQKSNCFRSEDSVVPWTRLAEAEANESTRDYVDRMTRSAPRNNMM